MNTWAKYLVLSLIVGAILAGLSGLFVTPGRLGIDVEYRGVPLEWRAHVIPTRFESVNWGNLLLDLVFWTVIVLVVVSVARRVAR